MSVLLPCLLALTFVVGCSDRQKRRWSYRSPAENYKTAIEAEHPDQRRDAVARIAESGYVDSEDAFVILDAVARTDPAPQIRCTAIRAFARYEDNRPIRPLLFILEAKTGKTSQALPADENIRWDIVLTLDELTRKGVLEGEQPRIVREVLIRLLETDTSREVRLAAAGALGEFPDRTVLAALIRTLADRDFGLADQAERSLIRLTGMTFDYDAEAWEAWLAGTSDPFAQAGQTPVTTRPAGPSWWEQQQRSFRRAIKLSSD